VKEHLEAIRPTKGCAHHGHELSNREGIATIRKKETLTPLKGSPPREVWVNCPDKAGPRGRESGRPQKKASAKTAQTKKKTKCKGGKRKFLVAKEKTSTRSLGCGRNYGLQKGGGDRGQLNIPLLEKASAGYTTKRGND